MEMSVWIAKFVGPVFLALGIAMATQPRQIEATSRQFLANPPLILITGVLAMIGGIAIVSSHDLWVADWRVVITLLGWALLIGGAIRVMLPVLVERVGNAMMAQSGLLRGAGLGWAILGLFLTYKGYG